jgi:hypothetical protein
VEGGVGGATDFSFPTATVLLTIRVLCDLLCTSMAATESHRGWWSTRRPAGLVIDQKVFPQEMAGLCSSSATPRDMHSSRWVIANSLNFGREEDDFVARISGCHHRSDVGFPMDEEVQNEGGGGGVNRMSDDFAAAEEAPDSRRPVMGVDDDDHAALLAAGALLDLSTSLVDEGYNTSSIGSSTGNVIKTQKPRRKQTTTQQAQVKLEPGISESNDDDRHEGTKRIEEEPLVADQTAKRRRMRKAWTDFETPLSVGKKRSEEESGESEKGSVITTQAETTTTTTTTALLLPRPTERGGKWEEDKKSVVVMTEQQTCVLPRPANRKRYRPLEKLMQETPVVTSVYSEDD